MIAKLFRRLTADPAAGAALFDWATSTARQRDWYVEGPIPDTIDGRFSVLSTVTALCVLRLEELGSEGERVSVALTERFAEVMESEHRELGLGDPTLGKTVLKLVGLLARRVEVLRPAMRGDADWVAAAEGAFVNASDKKEWLGARLAAVAGDLRAATLDQLARGEVR